MTAFTTAQLDGRRLPRVGRLGAAARVRLGEAESAARGRGDCRLVSRVRGPAWELFPQFEPHSHRAIAPAVMWGASRREDANGKTAVGAGDQVGGRVV